MTPFYVIGGITAAWAVLLSALGIARHRFPATGGAARIVMGISTVLVAATIASALVGGIVEEEEGEEHEATEPDPAPEASGRQQALELAAAPSGRRPS
ncbi:MAG TPA: hypothetical protein VGR10_07270 [Thermoleophilaceae bacterium]|nr:hypothetical protein [Thermoleophilaceae bacterium]